MAISFGDAALAFAGGAATQFNKIVDEERQAQTRMQERAQQMMDNIAAKQVESDYTREVEDFHKNESLYSSLSAVGGPSSPQGQVVLADYYGLDLANVVKTGAFGTLKVPERSGAPIPMTERAEALYGSLYEPAKIPFARRVRSKLNGTFFAPNGEAVPRGVSIDERGRPDPRQIVQATGVSLEDPAWMLEDASTRSPEEWQKAGMAILTGDKKFDFKVVPDVGLVRVESSTGQAKTVIKAGDKEQNVTESVSYFEDKVTGEIIRPTRQGGQYYWGDQPINIRDYTPITDDTGTQKAEKTVGTIEQMRARQAALGNFEAGLNNYKRVVTEATTGATGVVLDVGSYLQGTVAGVGELLGVDPITPAEREDLFEDANINMDEFIGGDKQALRGMVKQDAQQLIYTLAGILKDDADIGRTSVADVQNAAKMIQQLGSTDSGFAAIKSLESTLDIKKASVNQRMYQTRGVAPQDKLTAGVNLLRLHLQPTAEQWSQIQKQIVVNPRTGQVAMNMPGQESPMTLDQIIATYGLSGQLRPVRRTQAK